jgi:hypothetical protein
MQDVLRAKISPWKPIESCTVLAIFQLFLILQQKTGCGFMLDLCDSRDGQRIDVAVETWLQSLDIIPYNNAPMQRGSCDK